MFAWTLQPSRVQARSLSPAGTLGAIISLSATGRRAHDPQVAVDAVGNAVVVWVQGDRVQTRSLSARGELGPAVTLSAGGAAVHYAQVAMSADGDAVFVWDRATRAKGVVQARVRSASATLGPLLTLSARGQRAIHPRLAVAAGGHAMATWTRSANRRRNAGHRVQARSFSVGGKLGTILNVSGVEPGPSDDLPDDPGLPYVGASTHATLLADGTAVFTWLRVGSPNRRLLMRTRSPAGRWGPILTRLVGRSAVSAQVAFGPDGDGILAWQRLDGPPFDGSNAHVVVRSLSAEGTLGPTVTLSPPGGNVDVPRVAVAANGSAIVVWRRGEGDRLWVQGAAGP